MSRIRTLVGATVYYPRRQNAKGRTFTWLWLRRSSGVIGQMLMEGADESWLALRPGTVIRATGYWRKRRTSPFSAEDRTWFFVVHELEILRHPVPGPTVDLTGAGCSGGALPRRP